MNGLRWGLTLRLVMYVVSILLLLFSLLAYDYWRLKEEQRQHFHEQAERTAQVLERQLAATVMAGGVPPSTSTDWAELVLRKFSRAS